MKGRDVFMKGHKWLLGFVCGLVVSVCALNMFVGFRGISDFVGVGSEGEVGQVVKRVNYNYLMNNLMEDSSGKVMFENSNYKVISSGLIEETAGNGLMFGFDLVNKTENSLFPALPYGLITVNGMNIFTNIFDNDRLINGNSVKSYDVFIPYEELSRCGIDIVDNIKFDLVLFDGVKLDYSYDDIVLICEDCYCGVVVENNSFDLVNCEKVLDREGLVIYRVNAKLNNGLIWSDFYYKNNSGQCYYFNVEDESKKNYNCYLIDSNSEGVFDFVVGNEIKGNYSIKLEEIEKYSDGFNEWSYVNENLKYEL